MKNSKILKSILLISGLLLSGVGTAILLGAFIHKLSYTSTIVSFVVFVSFGLGRVLSIVLDGMPSRRISKSNCC
jgi:hypothetical protein